MSDQATIGLRADNKSLHKDLTDSERMFQEWGDHIEHISHLMGLHVGIELGHIFLEVAEKIGEFLGEVPAAAAQIEQSQTRLAAVLKATEGAAGLTNHQLEEMAEHLEHNSTFSRKAATDAEALLLTFKNIKGDNFKETLDRAADFASLMGTDLPQAARLLGRALDQPGQGMIALSRAGIRFSTETKELIKNLQAAGRTEEAQGVILEELKGRIGGVAEAMGNTFLGKWEKFKNHLEKVAEKMGQVLLPIMSAIVDFMDGALSSSTEGMISGFESAVKWVIEAAQSIWEFFKPALEYLVGANAAVGNVITGSLLPALGGLAQSLVETAATILRELAPVAEVLMEVLRVLLSFSIETTSTILTVVTNLWNFLRPIFGAIWEGVKFLFQPVWDFVKPALEWLAQAAATVFTVLETILENFQLTCKVVALSFALSFVRAFEVVKYWLTQVVPAYLSWFGRNWKNIFNDLWEGTKTVLENLWENIKSFWDGVVALFRGEGFGGFTWKPLLDGFKATTEELPKIAARVAGETEQALESELGKAADAFGQKLSENLQKNLGILKDPTKKFGGMMEGYEGHGEPPTPRRAPPDDPGKPKKGKDSGLQIEDLVALNKRITLAAATLGKESPEERAADAAEVEVAESRTQTKILEDIRDHNESMVAKFDEVRESLDMAGALV